jgi:diacylglycerol kinase (ATP)
LQSELARLGNAQLHVTAQRGDAVGFARQAVENGCELIIAAGGDGTLNEVINGIAENGSAIRIGLLPLGTGNDFARTLGITDDLDLCIHTFLNGDTKPVDLVRVTSDELRYFVNVSAGGFSGAVSENLTSEIKQTWGPLAYVRSAAASLPELEAYETTIVLDDSETLSLRVYNVIVGNGRFVAGGIPVAPAAIVDDGLIDLVLILERPAAELTMTITQLMFGNHLENDGVIFRRATKIAVHSTPGMWFNVDGEMVGKEPALFEVLPKALQFVVPKS